MNYDAIREESKLHWAVDSIVTRDGSFFGFGWVFHEEYEVKEVDLKVQYKNDESRLIAASYGKLRNDVADSFSRFPYAAHSGFFLLGCSGREQAAFSELFLRVIFNNGSQSALSIQPDKIKINDATEIVRGRVATGQLLAAAQRSMYLLRRFEVTKLLAKVRKYFSNRPTHCLTDPDSIKSILDDDELRNVVLVVDHDLGGGANQYREGMVIEKITGGATVLILSFALASLSFILIVRTRHKNERFIISGYNFLLELAERLRLVEIVYNTGVSFMRPERLPALIASLKRKYDPRLTLLVHDFFMVCPSHYLIDNAERYCGIPDMERCRVCLASNKQDFSSLFRSRDMVQWRTSWGEVIALADEVRTFSRNSRSLLQRAYPALDSTRIVVMPHTINRIQQCKIKPATTAVLKIGVVGQIGYHKGARVVRDLAREIRARGLPVKIVVIGTIEASCEPAVVSETGPYKHDRLAELIERAGVNIMLFPSIWPETFSYVVQELIEMRLPVACFDVGAPAERLRDYDKGMILEDSTSSDVLDDLIAFHRRLYLREQACGSGIG